ncbi:MAG: DUF1190 domain-containing protein [Rhodanobacter sp.]
MKRSRTAALLLLSTAPLLLTACDRNESSAREGVYTSVAACVAQTNDSQTCQQAFDKAHKDATETGPRFANREACDANYGAQQCEQRTDSDGHSFFGPLMTGFFLSQMMRGGSPMSGFTGGPAFRDANGQWKRPDTGGPSGGGYGGVYRSGSAAPAMVPVSGAADHATTVSRGGFGSSSGSRGFGS